MKTRGPVTTWSTHLYNQFYYSTCYMARSEHPDSVHGDSTLDSVHSDSTLDSVHDDSTLDSVHGDSTLDNV